MYIYLMQVCFVPQHTHAFSYDWTRFVWSLFYMQIKKIVIHRVSFDSVNRIPKKLGALLLASCNPVALFEQIVVDLVGDDAVPLIFWMLCDKLPHPLGHGHQFACFRGINDQNQKISPLGS